jgi:hypothetical protein
MRLIEKAGPAHPQRFEFVEREPALACDEELGLKEFLENAALSGDASEEGIGFLRKLRFVGKRPTSLYSYRELQNLRDPLHFRFVRSDRNAGKRP